MFQRVLQGYEMALGANLVTYFPSLNTTWALTVLYEIRADLPQARSMYTKALTGYMKVFGPDDSRSERLREKLQSLKEVTAG